MTAVCPFAQSSPRMGALCAFLIDEIPSDPATKKITKNFFEKTKLFGDKITTILMRGKSVFQRVPRKICESLMIPNNGGEVSPMQK